MTSHKFTRLFFALAALIVLAASALAGTAPANIGVSDQKAGSLLAFPYYTSQGSSDTRLTISNTGNDRRERSHVLRGFKLQSSRSIHLLNGECFSFVPRF